MCILEQKEKHELAKDLSSRIKPSDGPDTS
jgi:hypothetical protein